MLRLTQIAKRINNECEIFIFQAISIDDYTLRRSSDLVSDDSYLRDALNHILVPRAVGTANHTSVFKVSV